MSRRWEESIQERYATSHTANLEYLDLSQNQTPSTKELANNLSVIHNNINVSSLVHIKHFKQILSLIEGLADRVEKLEKEARRDRKALESLTKEVVENRPLTEKKVKDLVFQISEQSARLAQLSKAKLERVEEVLRKVESWVSS